MKIASIVGARPQFIKAAPVSRVLREAGHQEFLIHTGQHYDHGMSQVFFQELSIPEPDVNLGIGSGSHGQQTGRMLESLEEVINEQSPDYVIVYGDTNSTLAGALATAKLQIPVAHVEAGLRSFNKKMPEEINRIMTDHISDLLLCPTPTAVKNLKHEGISRNVYLVGDVMYDAVLYNIQLAENNSDILKKLGLIAKSYALATVHRAENTDDPERLHSIFYAFEKISENGLTLLLPLHPRTQDRLQSMGILLNGIRSMPPVSYLEMLILEKYARVIVTDSGGIQKEACWLGVPCVTLRDETEWIETVKSGWNVLAGSDPERIMQAVKETKPKDECNKGLYGNGCASKHIARIFSSSKWQG